MPLNWFTNIMNNIKSCGTQINQIESNMLGERQNFLEVFERNIELEKEIAERTEELHQANKSILTLKQIWRTMNSSEPLSEVLNTIVNGLSGDLGYLHCFVFQVFTEEEKVILRIRANANNHFSSKIKDIIDEPLDSFTIPFSKKDNILIESINNNKIQSTNNLSQLFNGCTPGIPQEKLDQLDTLLGNRAISILPITVQDNFFGCLAVVSIRKEISSTEKNFLSLFAGQIELSVTIAGLFEKIREQAITDGLTGLYNRRYFDQCLASEVDRAKRLNQPFTLITLDLDHLKQINDTYGHSAGDSAICRIGTVLLQNARSVDIPARFGGEEFSILLPGIDIEGGVIAAERLRAAIESRLVEGVGIITASVGVATFLRHADTIGELLEVVDQAMYKAKKNGRNQVQIAQKHQEADWQNVALNTFIDILEKKNMPIPAKTAKELVDKLKPAVVQQKELSKLLYYVVESLIKTYDPMYQKGFMKDKIEIIAKVAKELNIPKPEIDKIKLAALLCDIGNIMMPENILLKPGPLTEDERQKILEHPIIAARDILKPIKNAQNIICMVEHHHEHWDGTGYPNNLSGDEIPVGSRIIQITDAYFAMISDRPYRKALSQEEALNVLKRGANNEWDGRIVEVFVNIIQAEKAQYK